MCIGDIMGVTGRLGIWYLAMGAGEWFEFSV